MDLSHLLVFAGALLVAAAAPGPGIAALVARVLGRGAGGAVAFTVGLALGDVVWLTIAVAGLAVLAKSFAVLFTALRVAGAAYLLWLAYRLWTSPPAGMAATPAPEPPLRLFGAGLSVTLGNPKVIVFYLALVPGLVDLGALGVLGYAELVAAVLVVLAVVFSAYILAASRARRLFTSPLAQRRLNRGTGAVMAGAAIAVATR